MTTPTIWSRGTPSALPMREKTDSFPHAARSPFVYAALVAFSWLYYYRPEDFIPGLSHIPMAKITGLLGLIALLVGMASGTNKMPTAVKLLWLLVLQMFLCIPFAIWKGGAFNAVTEKFSKTAVVAMLISMAVVTVKELRKLLWIQVSAVALVVLV